MTRFRPALGHLAATVLIVAATAVPMLVLTVGALSRQWFFPQVLPRSLALTETRRVLTDRQTIHGLRDGVIVGIVVTALAVAAAWPTARVLARAPARWRIGAFALLFLPSVIPPVGLAIGIDVVLLRAHLDGHVASVALAHLVPTLPYPAGVLTAAFRRYDQRIDDQAALLGAHPWQRFRLVTFPLLRPGLAVAAAFAFLVSWSQYLLTLLTGSGHVITITMLLYNALSGGNPTVIGTLALVAAGPTVVLLAVTGHHLAEVNRR